MDFGKFKLLGGRTREAHIFIHSGMEEVKAYSQAKSGKRETHTTEVLVKRCSTRVRQPAKSNIH